MSLAIKTANLLMRSATSGTSRPNANAVLRAFLGSDETYATVLLLILLDTYGQEALEWSPATIRMQLEEDFAVELPDGNLDKIMAAVTIVTTNYFYQDPVRFVELCNILSGDDAEHDEFDPADVSEILWGISESFLLWPPEEADASYDTKFSAEILEYIRQTLTEEGFLKAPDIMGVSGLDETSFVRDTWSDDPEMYQAIYELHQYKMKDMKFFLHSNFQDLHQQLKALPMEEGNKESLMKRISAGEENARSKLS
jgi:hypothetical protein